jgi:taurine dioxygenase
MKQMLAPLRAVNSSSKAEKSRTREDRGANEAPRVLEAEHPVVRTHPETGRKALYVNGGHTLRFAGMTEAESAPLLEYLFAHQVRPEFTCRFHWEPGSTTLWTIAVRFTIRSTIITASAASCTALRSSRSMSLATAG